MSVAGGQTWKNKKLAPKVFFRNIHVFIHFTKFTWKHLCLSLFLNKVETLSLAILLKKRFRYKFLGTPFIKNTFELLILKTSHYYCYSCKQKMIFYENNRMTRNSEDFLRNSSEVLENSSSLSITPPTRFYHVTQIEL